MLLSGSKGKGTSKHTLMLRHFAIVCILMKLPEEPFILHLVFATSLVQTGFIIRIHPEEELILVNVLMLTWHWYVPKSLIR